MWACLLAGNAWPSPHLTPYDPSKALVRTFPLVLRGQISRGESPKEIRHLGHGWIGEEQNYFIEIEVHTVFIGESPKRLIVGLNSERKEKRHDGYFPDYRQGDDRIFLLTTPLNVPMKVYTDYAPRVTDPFAGDLPPENRGVVDHPDPWKFVEGSHVRTALEAFVQMLGEGHDPVAHEVYPVSWSGPDQVHIDFRPGTPPEFWEGSPKLSAYPPDRVLMLMKRLPNWFRPDTWDRVPSHSGWLGQPSR